MHTLYRTALHRIAPLHATLRDDNDNAKLSVKYTLTRSYTMVITLEHPQDLNSCWRFSELVDAKMDLKFLIRHLTPSPTVDSN